ncbi:uncharacterized protein LOC123694007 isoform X1 [Colias croceus]|uniref:uncharacterized protein LOC123694007 isoform X1 n=1 Tax=Colias crocea TaxID=72248 RepID=UPI001E27A39B|nr:uncharacterized protein LOC123694007 isoform X1 [Colias croceus]
MGKRKRSDSYFHEDLWKKLKKLERRLKKCEGRTDRDRESSPGTPPPSPVECTEDWTVEDIPEELLLALGKEAAKENIVGGEIQQQLTERWTNIIHQGLGKEARENLTTKYPSPTNFMAAVPPVLTEAIAAAMNEASKRQDKRIVFCQALIGKTMLALGKALTCVLTGNINTKEIVVQLNDSAKFAAEVLQAQAPADNPETNIADTRGTCQ